MLIFADIFKDLFVNFMSSYRDIHETMNCMRAKYYKNEFDFYV
jgi:hypothetical protein